MEEVAESEPVNRHPDVFDVEIRQERVSVKRINSSISQRIQTGSQVEYLQKTSQIVGMNCVQKRVELHWKPTNVEPNNAQEEFLEELKIPSRKSLFTNYNQIARRRYSYSLLVSIGDVLIVNLHLETGLNSIVYM